MQIDDKLIAHLEDISCLALTDNEKNSLKSELQEILNNMTLFNEFNTKDAEECSHPGNCVNIFRDDEVQPSFEQELILMNAPAKNDNMFIVPKTVV